MKKYTKRWQFCQELGFGISHSQRTTTQVHKNVYNCLEKEPAMKKPLLLWIIFALIFLPACDGWVYVVPTFPAPPPTITPSIYTPTPVFLTATYTYC